MHRLVVNLWSPAITRSKLQRKQTSVTKSKTSFCKYTIHTGFYNSYSKSTKIKKSIDSLLLIAHNKHHKHSLFPKYLKKKKKINIHNYNSFLQLTRRPNLPKVVSWKNLVKTKLSHIPKLIKRLDRWGSTKTPRYHRLRSAAIAWHATKQQSTKGSREQRPSRCLIRKYLIRSRSAVRNVARN